MTIYDSSNTTVVIATTVAKNTVLNGMMKDLYPVMTLRGPKEVGFSASREALSQRQHE